MHEILRQREKLQALWDALPEWKKNLAGDVVHPLITAIDDLIGELGKNGNQT